MGNHRGVYHRLIQARAGRVVRCRAAGFGREGPTRVAGRFPAPHTACRRHRALASPLRYSPSGLHMRAAMSAKEARGKSRPMFSHEQPPRPLNARSDSLRAAASPWLPPRFALRGAPPRRPKSPHKSTQVHTSNIIPLPPAAGHLRVAFPSVLATPRCRTIAVQGRTLYRHRA